MTEKIPQMMNTEKKQNVFKISRSYDLRQLLGQGAYGTVAWAIHKPTATPVAVKKIEPFNKTLVCLRTIRELQLLNFFANHDNIIGLLDVQKPKDFDSFEEVYLIQEYMPCDLHHIIHSLKLLNQHIKFIVYQILRGLRVIHSANVIHRDLKPSNILINWACEVKICDFGLARIVGSELLELESNLTEYVATRWYRAPEIMLLQAMYSTSVDLWSVGCILAELFLAYPLFPGKDYKNQLQLIFEFLGTPTGTDMKCVRLERAKAYIDLLPHVGPRNIEMFFNNHQRRIHKYGCEPVDSDGLELMSNLLSFNPERRFTASQALRHPYLDTYNQNANEPISSIVLEPTFLDRKRKRDLDMHDLKQHLYEEIINFSNLRY